MSGADICDLSSGVADIEDIVGVDDVTPRERYKNKPVPVPKVRKPQKNKCEVSNTVSQCCQVRARCQTCQKCVLYLDQQQQCHL